MRLEWHSVDTRVDLLYIVYHDYIVFEIVLNCISLNLSFTTQMYEVTCAKSSACTVIYSVKLSAFRM